MEKTGRNDPCPCGSGKKYKKCCEIQKSKGFAAQKIEPGQSANRLTSLFKQRVSDGSSSNPGDSAKPEVPPSSPEDSENP